MGAETLASIATTTPAGQAIFRVLSKEEKRNRKETNLHWLFLETEDNSLTYADFLSVWKQLDNMGVGSLVTGRGGAPDRFKWGYGLRDVATLAKEGKSLEYATPIGKKRTVSKRGRPKGSKNKRGKTKIVAPKANIPVQAAPTPTYVQLTINLPEKANIKDVQALLEMAKSLQ